MLVFRRSAQLIGVAISLASASSHLAAQTGNNASVQEGIGGAKAGCETGPVGASPATCSYAFANGAGQGTARSSSTSGVVRSYADISVAGPLATGTAYESFAGVYFSDRISFGALVPRFIEFDLHFTGNVAVSSIITGTQRPVPFVAGTYLNVLTQAEGMSAPGFVTQFWFGNVNTGDGFVAPGQLPIDDRRTRRVTLAQTSSYLDLILMGATRIGPFPSSTNGPFSGNFVGVVNAENTFRVEGLRFYDAANNDITQAVSYTTMNGLLVSAVPEPGTVVLLLVTLPLVMYARRRPAAGRSSS